MKYVSVSDVVRRIKEDIQGDYRLQSIAMEGNIMGLKRASNGHYYMTLHDEYSSIRAILFRSHVGRSIDNVREGDHVIVIGAINVYEKGGTVSFIIERLFSKGMGTLQAQLERLKQELAEKGYFSPDHKKTLPRFPWTVGVLTSQTGAVLHDIHKIAAERNPYIPIRLFPIPVQGDGAAEVIARTLRDVGKRTDLDVLILARGGGSLEDLWCFNSPDVVKAIYDVPLPIITAIGHETDTTLADYAADVRAATPTHAAELAFPDIHDIELDLSAMTEQAYTLVMRQIERWQQLTAATSARLQPQQYGHFLTLKETQIHQLTGQALQRLTLALTQKQGSLGILKGKLQGLNPAELVKKGYGQLSQRGKLIATIEDVSTDDPLSIQLLDGTITTAVKEVRKHGTNNR